MYRLALRVRTSFSSSGAVTVHHGLLASPSTGWDTHRRPRLGAAPVNRADSLFPLRRIYELQAFLTVLVSNFQFELTEDVHRICKTTAITMVPTLEGEVEKGAQMPLRVSLAPREE